MTYEFFNDWHLGDCLFQCLYFHRLAPKFPNARENLDRVRVRMGRTK